MADSTARPAAIRDLGDGDIGVWVRYEDREHAKALPGARWDKHLKCWRVSSFFRADAQSLVTGLNMQSNGITSVSVPTSLRDLFRAIPVRLRPATYKALAKAWHPDAGGDHALMQQLNAVQAGLR